MSRSTSPSVSRRERRRVGLMLAATWVCFLFRGALYSVVLPIWEGYDEPYHFASIQYFIATRSLPGLYTPISREVEASLHFVPLSRAMGRQGIRKPFYTHDDLWKLSPEERESLEKKFREIPSSWANESPPGAMPNYEGQQPPLFYALFSLLMRALHGRSLASRVFILRFAAIAVASLVIPLGYAVTKRITGTSETALGIVALAAVMPEFCIDMARVGNECLGLVIYTVLLYVATRIVEGPAEFGKLPVAGFVLGVGLLTKAYFLTALPALLVIVLWCGWRWPKEWKRLLSLSGVAVFAALAIAAPWYWHVRKANGAWSGLVNASLPRRSQLEVLAQIPHVHWVDGLLSLIVSHIWYGGWSFLRAPVVWYVFFGTVFLLAGLGLLLVLFRFRRPDKSNILIGEGHLVMLVSLYGFFWLGQLYFVLLLFISLRISTSPGWYLYCLVIAELILVYIGLQAILPRRTRPWIIPILTAGFAALDLYGMHFLLIPYYTGVIAHAGYLDCVSPSRIRDLLGLGVHNVARRLLVNRPTTLTPGVLYVLWLLGLMGTVWIAIRPWCLRQLNTLGSATATTRPGQGCPLA
ncbi:MAG TPA: glycosyltransferase family 39 protein [Terriglobia bacterium]|nr:glycosyltransferase family 39 protein [Terriglobia bacterium]